MDDRDGTAKARFEPPPWELEAFEALAARRAEEQAAREALEAAASAGAGGAALEPDPWDEVPNEPVMVLDGDAAGDAQDPGKAAGETAGGAAIDERAVQAMLVQLKGEERVDSRVTKRVGQIASVLTFLLGAGMTIAGLAMMRSGGAKQVAVVGSLVLSVFGLSFIGMATWVWITTNRLKGRS
jgi:hypothetical protein